MKYGKLTRLEWVADGNSMVSKEGEWILDLIRMEHRVGPKPEINKSYSYRLYAAYKSVTVYEDSGAAVEELYKKIAPLTTESLELQFKHIFAVH